MGRQKRQSLDYFPMDVDYITDYKVRRLLRKHGRGAIALYFGLLSEVYGKCGYYLEWTAKSLMTVAELYRCEEEDVDDVIITCLEEGLFSTEMYEKYGILTSAGIQRRYLMACKERIRNLKHHGRTLDLNLSIWLLSQEETQKLLLDMQLSGVTTAGDGRISTGEIPEEEGFLLEKVHKVKQSKEEERKAEQTRVREACVPPRAEPAVQEYAAPAQDAALPAAPHTQTQWRFKLMPEERKALESVYGADAVQMEIYRLQDWASERGYYIKYPVDKLRSWLETDTRKEKLRREEAKQAAPQMKQTSAHMYDQRKYTDTQLEELLYTDIDHLND